MLRLGRRCGRGGVGFVWQYRCAGDGSPPWAFGVQVFFIPENPSLPPDPTILAKILSNGGRNDIVVVSMWADMAISQYSKGMWGFFSPCTA